MTISASTIAAHVTLVVVTLVFLVTMTSTAVTTLKVVKPSDGTVFDNLKDDTELQVDLNINLASHKYLRFTVKNAVAPLLNLKTRCASGGKYGTRGHWRATVIGGRFDKIQMGCAFGWDTQSAHFEVRDLEAGEIVTESNFGNYVGLYATAGGVRITVDNIKPPPAAAGGEKKVVNINLKQIGWTVRTPQVVQVSNIQNGGNLYLPIKMGHECPGQACRSGDIPTRQSTVSNAVFENIFIGDQNLATTRIEDVTVRDSLVVGTRETTVSDLGKLELDDVAIKRLWFTCSVQSKWCSTDGLRRYANAQQIVHKNFTIAPLHLGGFIAWAGNKSGTFPKLSNFPNWDGSGHKVNVFGQGRCSIGGDACPRSLFLTNCGDKVEGLEHCITYMPTSSITLSSSRTSPPTSTATIIPPTPTSTESEDPTQTPSIPTSSHSSSHDTTMSAHRTPTHSAATLSLSATIPVPTAQPTLEPTPAPRKPISITTEVLPDDTVLSTATGSAVVTSAYAGTGTVTSAGRVSAATRALDCPLSGSAGENPDPPSWYELPIQFAVDDGRLGTYAGAAVGNSTVTAFVVLVSMVWQRYGDRDCDDDSSAGAKSSTTSSDDQEADGDEDSSDDDDDQEREGKSNENSGSRSKKAFVIEQRKPPIIFKLFSAIGSAFFLYLGPNSLGAATTVLFHADTSLQIMCAVATFVQIVSVAAIYFYMIGERAPQLFQAVPEEEPRAAEQQHPATAKHEQNKSSLPSSSSTKEIHKRSLRMKFKFVPRPFFGYAGMGTQKSSTTSSSGSTSDEELVTRRQATSPTSAGTSMLFIPPPPPPPPPAPLLANENTRVGKHKQNVMWFFSLYAPLFDGTSNFDSAIRRLYSLPEFASASLAQILSGVRPDNGCIDVAWGILLVSVLMLVYLLYFRPYRTKLDEFFSIFMNLLQVSLTICTVFVLQQRIDDPEHLVMKAIEIILYVLVGLYYTQAVIQAYWAYHCNERRRRYEEQQQQQQQSPALPSRLRGANDGALTVPLLSSAHEANTTPPHPSAKRRSSVVAKSNPLHNSNKTAH